MTDHNHDHDVPEDETTESFDTHYLIHAMEYTANAHDALMAAIDAGQTPGQDIIAARYIDEANAWSRLASATAAIISAYKLVEMVDVHEAEKQTEQHDHGRGGRHQ